MDLVPACVSRQARARTEGPPHAACTEAARTASLWYDSEQVGVCVQRRAMSGSRAVAAKVVKSRQEPNLVNADRITTSTGKLQGCPLQEGVENGGTHAQFRQLAGAQTVVGRSLVFPPMATSYRPSRVKRKSQD